MKRVDQQEKSRFNEPSVIGERVVYLLCLLGIVTGPLVLIVAVIGGQRILGVAALAVLALAGGCWLWLQAGEKLARTNESLDELINGGTQSTAGLSQLIALLQRWDEMEHKRGGPDFDPWVVQSLRHEIQVAIREDPRLERLFHY